MKSLEQQFHIAVTFVAITFKSVDDILMFAHLIKVSERCFHVVLFVSRYHVR